MVIAVAAAVVCSQPVQAQEQDETRSANSVNMQYVGGDSRISIGVDSEFDLTGEFWWLFADDSDSSWLGQVWVADEAGGVKLNYHWLADGAATAQGADGQTVYLDGKVRKLFIAVDQNEFDDRKVTFGGGSEVDNRFWSIYGMSSITGTRNLGQSVSSNTVLIPGFVGNHASLQTDVTVTTTDFFAHPYEWGLGFRVGKFWENSETRLRGGLDYEDGDRAGASQTTASLSLDKYFSGGHSITLTAGYARKKGDFETDKSDGRAGIFYNYDFGGNSRRPAHIYRDVETVVQEARTTSEQRTVMHDVTIESGTVFELDKATLTEEALSALGEFLERLSGFDSVTELSIAGHTCDLASDEYNLGLSERRANSVAAFLREHGLADINLLVSGRGESQPKYPNDGEENRSRNRRVELSFAARQETIEDIQVEHDAIVEWRQQEIPQDAAWIRRALRNPIRHKRHVDFYQYEESSSVLTSSTEVFNDGPSAIDDALTVQKNSSGNVVVVLGNDSDPESDPISILAVTQGANGSVSISGSSLIYTPNPGFAGTDSFTYTIQDNFDPAATSTATVTVTVQNTTPVAVADSAETTEGIAVFIDVLPNDSDADGDLLTIVAVSQGTHGTVAISGSQVVYTPSVSFPIPGTDMFTYTVSDDSGAEATATVTVTIPEPPNQAPVAQDDMAEVPLNWYVDIDVLANDSDPDGDELTIISVDQDPEPMGDVFLLGGGIIQYQPHNGWFGEDAFTYTISDGKGGEATATVFVTIGKIPFPFSELP